MSAPSQPTFRSRHRWAWLVVIVLATYLLVAYGVAPTAWRMYAHRHADFTDSPRITQTGTGNPGDPLNISLAGTDAEVVGALTAAAWYPADPITFRSSVRIAVDTVFRRRDDQAPVSNLFLYGRKQDLAFEKPVGGSPKERHHVRLWRSDMTDEDRPVWMGAAIYDMGVELSRRTGQVTHHIGPKIDVERDFLIEDLKKAGQVKEFRWMDNFHVDRSGRNGGGDPWETDGRLGVVVLRDSGPAKP